MSPTPANPDARWAALEGRAYRPEVQEEIRRQIRKGTFRVVPTGDGGIRIIPNRPVRVGDGRDGDWSPCPPRSASLGFPQGDRGRQPVPLPEAQARDGAGRVDNHEAFDRPGTLGGPAPQTT